LLFVYLPFLLFSQGTNSELDTLEKSPYTSFIDKLIVYADLGYSSAPFSIRYNFSPEVQKLRFKNNFSPILGVGISYKWFSFRIGLPLKGSAKSIDKFGITKSYNLGSDFTIKKTFIAVDLRNYIGYVIQNASNWNDTLTNSAPNAIRKNTRVFNFSTHAWYFHDKNFKMSALRGMVGHYEKEVKTWYVKSSFNAFGIRNGSNSIVPEELWDEENDKTATDKITAVDIGIIPGYAYVNKIKNWQFSILGGFGAAIQSKYYAHNSKNRAFLGLSPRFDIKFIGGYSVPRFFVFFITDFDTKSIYFNDFRYNQTFYMIKLSGGIRLQTRPHNNRFLKRIYL